MKKHILSILLFLGLFIIIIASTWPTTSKVALECENNITNTGNGSYTFSYGAGTYSSTIKPFGGYSAGPIVTTSGAITSNSNITDIIQQVQFYSYHLSTGQVTYGTTYYNSHTTTLAYVYANQMYLYDPVGGQIGPFSFTMNAWHLWIIDFDGTHQDLWLDGVHQGQMSAYQFLGNDGVVFGARNAGEDCDCYFKNIILDTHDNAGVEITPVVPTPTFTITPTSTYTPTPTSTSTPTYTYTPTYTPTPTLTFTITPTFTNSPVASATFTPIISYVPTPPVVGNRIIGFRITFSNGLFTVSMIGDNDFLRWLQVWDDYAIIKPTGYTIIPLYQ